MKTAALKYLGLGCNVMPVRPDKKPYLMTWAEYQEQKVTPLLIEKWWTTWPMANIAIITGVTSDIVVIDVDSEEGLYEVDKLAPDMHPTVKTPNGWHFYFRHSDNGIGNATRFIPDCDVRGQGGYVVAPPSINESGIKYKQLLPINDLETLPPAMLS